mgnify:CR=1 FL=1
MAIALGCAPRDVTSEVVVRLLDHPRFKDVEPRCVAIAPKTARGSCTPSHRKLTSVKRVSPIVLIGLAGIYVTIIVDVYLRFLS